MNNKNSNKKKAIGISVGLFLLIGSFFIYKITGALSGDNELKMKTAKITSIETGSGSFDANDGFTYDNSNTAYTLDDGFIPGNDASENNRIVRSFDTIKYNLEFSLASKIEGNDYDSRTVNVEVLLSDEEAKYVTFDQNSLPGEKSHIYSFDGIDTYEAFQRSITLYVLGAPNKTEIKPIFNIKESTDEDNAVSLGYISSNQSNYSYEDGTYSGLSNIMNYLPTIVSSTDGKLLIDIEPASADSQKAIYDGKNGRFVTYVAGVYLEADTTKGLKGKTMPTGDITFNASVTHSGSNSLVQESSWNRLYSSNGIGDIEPVAVSLPYSTNDSNYSQKEIFYPGDMSVVGENGNLNVTISNYGINYRFPSLNADDSVIENRGYIGTYAFAFFSPRVSADGRVDINDTLSITNINATSTNGNLFVSENSNRTLVNSYYMNEDYSLKTDFVTMDDKSLSNEIDGNVVGTLSKGESLMYKTVFNLNETGSSNGLKETIKINQNAFRVIPFSDKKDIIIETKCGDNNCENIDETSFEVKYLTGNYVSNNYSLKEIDSKILDEVKGDITSSCSAISIGELNPDQIMNLYGGPCIKANQNVESEYLNIIDAVNENNKEIPITKVIVQTKEGVTLPDNVEVTVKVKLRVRNVQDITRTYQATTIATTSDYDSVLRYYSPTAPEQVTNPNNYQVAIINGNAAHKVSNELYGASLRIANFTANQEISVLNKNKDGSMKVNYNAVDNETIIYNIKTSIDDMNEQVGADDVWYMKSVNVYVILDNNLTHITDVDMDKYLVSKVDNGIYGTQLTYNIPYTKTNFTVPDIRFKAKINPKLKGSGKSLVVKSYIEAINVNNEIDASMFGLNGKSFEIYATGINNVIVEEQIGSQGTVVEKNTEFSYKLRAYNNTDAVVNDYSIVDILPSDGDYLGSRITGEYSIKIKMPESLASASIKCSRQTSASIVNEIKNNKNEWEDCNITEDYVEGVTAIRIDNIVIPLEAYTDFIEVFIKPTNNNYSDVYYNSFIGGSETLSTTKSNSIGVNVVSRTIKGKVFIDVNENGVKDKEEINVSRIPVTLYKLDNDSSTKVFETTTDKDGNYNFKDLDVGRYYIDLNYNSSIYDLTLRYATENTDLDSDAYIVNEKEGLARISNKKVPNDPYGIRLTRNDIKIENMDMGLISKKSFSFEMKKYITRIDLAYNGSINTTNYNNLSKVSINVKNSLNATAKVYYGISVTNNGTRPGYVREIQEDIPKGLIFDSNYNENDGWIEVNGTLKNTTLSDIIIEPGETKYLKIVLFMPSRASAGSFLNTVSVVSMEEYIPAELVADTTDVASTKYVLGEAVSYAGYNWHVIGTEEINENEQKVTLFADANQFSSGSHGNGTYSWGNSSINALLNDNYAQLKAIDKSALYDINICNDASGLPLGSYGGSINGLCQSQMFVTSKIRLITKDEIDYLRQSSLSSLGWLFESNFWTQSSDYVNPSYNEFGVQTNSVANKALSIENGNPTETDISIEKEIRPVITISSKKILFE